VIGAEPRWTQTNINDLRAQPSVGQALAASLTLFAGPKRTSPAWPHAYESSLRLRQHPAYFRIKEIVMSKEQNRGNRESRKPKKVEPKQNASNPSTKPGLSPEIARSTPLGKKGG
jgi:hypothetical protein